eukprot:9024941-Heterocapsa_arctica.AAC.1
MVSTFVRPSRLCLGSKDLPSQESLAWLAVWLLGVSGDNTGGSLLATDLTPFAGGVWKLKTTICIAFGNALPTSSSMTML